MSVAQTLFMQEPGDVSAISINDVNQGWLGDCFVCAPIAALALQRPDYIQSMIRDNGNGTQSVRLYLDPSYFYNVLAPRFTVAADNSTWITVHDSDLGPGMNTNNGGQLIVNGVQEIWPQVIENAISQVVGGYNVLNYGGSAAPIMRYLTGASAIETYISPTWGGNAQPTTAQLRADLVSKDMVTFFTGAPNGYSLQYNHEYTLTSVDTVNGVDYAHFRNPWGYGDPQPVPVSDLGNAFVGMDVGTVPLLSTILNSAVPNPVVKTITGLRGGGVALNGTSQANTTITISDNVGGRASVLGTTTTSSTGTWQFVSPTAINTGTINSFSATAQNAAGVSSAGSSMLFLASTGNDTFNATDNVSEVFAIMSFRGSDVINGFQTTSATGAAHDYIDLSGRGITSFSQVHSMMSGTSSTIINIGSGKTITLADVAPTLLTASDFRYS